MPASTSGNQTGIDVLIYVEDPGAANYCADLPEALERRGWRVRLVAEGFALACLRSRGAPVEELAQSFTVQDVLDRTRPRLVVTGTSENLDTFGFELIAGARARGVTSAGVVDTAGNADYRFRGRTEEPLHHAPDWLAVPDSWTRDAYIALGYPAERIAVCGHPQYDRVLSVKERLDREDRRHREILFPGAGQNPVVVFAAEISGGLGHNFHRSPDYTLEGRGGRDGRTDIVLEEFLDAVDLLKIKPYLVLRLHPKNTLEELAPYLPGFQKISRSEPPLELVYSSDLVVGMNSMLLMEAAIMGRPTLSIVPREAETKTLPTVRAGITPCVTKRRELRTVLPDLLQNCFQPLPVDVSSLVSPGSLERTAAFLESLLCEPSNR